MTKKLNKWQIEVVKLKETAEEQVQKELQKAYQSILKDVRKDLRYWLDGFDYEKVPEWRRKQLAELVALDNELVAVLKDSGQVIEPILTSYKELQMTEGYYSTFYQIEAQSKVTVDFLGLNKELIRDSVSSSIDGLSLSERLKRNHGIVSRKAADIIRNGLTLGESYSEMARKITEETGALQRQAMTIVRTEGGQLRSEGRLRGQREAKNLGIDLKKRWVSTLDSKTRSTHRSLDGQVREVDDMYESFKGNRGLAPNLFGVASEDINCRCESVIEIEDIPPSIRRDNVSGEIITYKTYKEWYKERVEKGGTI